MSDLLASIQATIKKNIPEQVGKELKKRIEELEYLYSKLVNDHATLQDKYEAMMLIQSKLEDDIVDYEFGAEKVKQETTRLHLLQDDLNFRQSFIELKETHAQEKCDIMMEMFKIPFANRTVRETVNSQVPLVSEVVGMGSQCDCNTGCYKEMPLRQDVLLDSVETKTTEEA